MDFRFQDFNVYKEAKKLHGYTIREVNKFPNHYRYLADQMRRAALSIVLNIAEGAGKNSDKDFNRYIQNALGSVSELAAAYDVAATERLIDDIERAFHLLTSIRKQLGGLSKKLLVDS